MKISRERLKQIIKEEMMNEADPAEDIKNQVRGKPEIDYLANRQEVEKALATYFLTTSTPAVLNATNFVLGWLKASKRQ